MTAKISESDLAELLFPHTDFKTFIALSKVSKKFNAASKRKLIRKEKIDTDGSKAIWTELPIGLKHGLTKGWYSNGKLRYIQNYNDGLLHGPCQVWFRNGQLFKTYNYNHGKLIENSNN